MTSTPGQVHAHLVGQPTNLAHALEIVQRVQPDAALRAGWLDQPGALVVAQRLLVDADQARRDADDKRRVGGQVRLAKIVVAVSIVSHASRRLGRYAEADCAAGRRARPGQLGEHFFFAFGQIPRQLHGDLGVEVAPARRL